MTNHYSMVSNPNQNYNPHRNPRYNANFSNGNSGTGIDPVATIQDAALFARTNPQAYINLAHTDRIDARWEDLQVAYDLVGIADAVNMNAFAPAVGTFAQPLQSPPASSGPSGPTTALGPSHSAGPVGQDGRRRRSTRLTGGPVAAPTPSSSTVSPQDQVYHPSVNSPVQPQANVTIVPINHRGSDGDASYVPTPAQINDINTPYQRVNQHPVWLQRLGNLWMQQRGEAQDGVHYQIDQLPAGFNLYERYRTGDTSHLDRYLYGHFSHKRYRSPQEFFPHFLYLMERGNANGCTCALCADYRRGTGGQGVEGASGSKGKGKEKRK